MDIFSSKSISQTPLDCQAHACSCAYVVPPQMWRVLPRCGWVGKKEDEGPDDQSNWMPVEDTLVWTIVRLLAVGSILGWILGDLIFCSPFKSFEFDLQTCLACARVAWPDLH